MTRCPINKAQNIRCGCKDESCTSCSAVCTVCDVAGHEPDNVDVAIVARASPQWSCEKHDMADMQVRLQGAIKNMPPTVREQNEAARGHKRALAEIHPMDGQRFRAHVAQSDVIDLTGLGGAAAATAVRTAVGVAAAAQDAGASRPASRTLGAYASDVGARPAGGTTQPIPGALGAVELDKRRASVVATLEDTLRQAPAYSAANRASQRRRNREAGVGGRGLQEPDEVLGSSNPFFGVKGKELKRAALRYLALPEVSEQTRVKLTMGKFIGEGRVFTGASVTCSVLSCKTVCGALMECAASVDLTVPSVLASMRQFNVEVRRGDEDLHRFFGDHGGRPSTAGSASSS